MLQSKTTKLAKLAMMIAFSCVLVLFIRIPFPLAPFLIYDPADIPIYITTFAFGPLAGILVTLIVSLIQAFFLNGDGVYGFLMHLVATGSFVIIAGLLYKRNKTRKGALKALIAGIIVMIVVMAGANLIVTPIFLGMPVKAVVGMLPVISLFNLIKGGLNALVTFFVYKRISSFLHK